MRIVVGENDSWIDALFRRRRRNGMENENGKISSSAKSGTGPVVMV
jgi:hypothetical protein